MNWKEFADSVAGRLKRAIRIWCESPYHTADDEADCFYSLASLRAIPDLIMMFQIEAGITNEEVRQALQMPEEYRKRLENEMYAFLTKMGEEWERRLKEELGEEWVEEA